MPQGRRSEYEGGCGASLCVFSADCTVTFHRSEKMQSGEKEEVWQLENGHSAIVENGLSSKDGPSQAAGPAEKQRGDEGKVDFEVHAGPSSSSKAQEPPAYEGKGSQAIEKTGDRPPAEDTSSDSNSSKQRWKSKWCE